MRRVGLALTILWLLAALAGCSSCGGKESKPVAAGFVTGFTSMDDLVKTYLEAIEKKDPNLLKDLMLSPDDLAALQSGKGRQYWQGYFQVGKRAFMEKNKAFMGQKLEMTRYTPGREIASKEAVKVYRGTMVYFKMPDNDKEFTSEINFIIETQGKFKVLGFKYLSDELKRRGVFKDLGIYDGEAKFKGVDGVKDVAIKVKKVNKNGGEKPGEEPAEGQE
ncbi:MAG: hypothetical protein GX444_06475 [Myxococcales bacterium]|nr:hypothetical protein [Myxococcales bacterium]